MNITQIGIDLAKLVFQYTGLIRAARPHCASS
jgi:hypothetical protein